MKPLISVDKLKAMRTRYDAALAQGRRESVDYDHYREFSIFFDRQTAWSEKVKTPKTKKQTSTTAPSATRQ